MLKQSFKIMMQSPKSTIEDVVGLAAILVMVLVGLNIPSFV